MKTRIVNSVVVIICIISCTYFITSVLKKSFSSNIDNNDKAIAVSTKTEDCLLFNLEIANRSVGFVFNSKATMESLTDSKDARAEEVFNHKYNLVVRISESHCRSCDVALMKGVYDNLNLIHKENIIVLGSYFHRSNMVEFLNENDLNGLNSYNFNKSIQLDIETYNFPYLMVVDKNGSVISCFLPEKGIPELSSIYLKGIAHLFATEKS